MVALAPQIFNDYAYCGDFTDFDLALQAGTLEVFLMLTENDCFYRSSDNSGNCVNPVTVIFDDQGQSIKQSLNLDYQD